ncbi:MAG: SpoIIE family protein phosphatase [Bacteroidales bacterium]
MKLKVGLITLFLITTLHAFSQEGSLFLTHFQKNNTSNVQHWSIAQDSLNNMFFANRKGILKYNGQTRDYIQVPFIPYSISYHSGSEKVFIGGDQEIGYLNRDEKGLYRYQSLASDSLLPGEFVNIEQVDSAIYFISEEMIVRADPNTLTIEKKWYAKENQPFTGLIHNDEHVFINQGDEGLHRLQGDTLFPIVSGFWTENKEILFSLPYSEDRLLIGTDDNQLYLFDGMKFYNFRLTNQSYIEESIMADAVNISDEHFALSTLAGGVVVIDKSSGEILYTINYQTGLPGDEITAIAMDRNRGLWISHPYGISRAALELPVRKFSTYPGIEGNLLNTIEQDSVLYLATGDGLYRLNKEKNYREDEIKVRLEEEVPVNTEPETGAQPEDEEETKENQQEEEKESPSAFKRFFNKLFGKNKEESKQEQDNETRQTPEDQQEAQTKTRISYKNKKIYSLQSISHQFKKVEGIEGRCEQLVPYEGGILAGTYNGLYHLNEQGEVTQVLRGQYPHHIYPTDKKGVLLATPSGITKATFQNGKWQTTEYLPQINGPVYSLAFNNHTGTLWVGGEDEAHKVVFDREGKVSTIQNHSLPAKYSQKYFVRSVEQEVYAFISSGVFRYHRHTDTFRVHPHYPVDSLLQTDYQYLLSQPGISWIKNQNHWERLRNTKEWQDSLSVYLELFDNIQNISISPTNHLWVIAENELYRIDLNKRYPKQKDFRAFFTTVRSGSERYLKHSRPAIKKENTPLTFNVAAPHYLKSGSNQYQYYIEGLMNEWSEWSNEPKIQFFAQKGDYRIKARARNIWGQISETKEIEYHVPPPFTETNLFYGLVALGLVGVIFMIIKLREEKLKRDKRILEEAVRKRTSTIEEQKEEIKVQRDEILKQKDTIEKKNLEITGSIEYAWRIQNALLPKKDQFKHVFSDYFILFKPQSIVSGDFYWIRSNEEKVYLTAADCTGHGVPGAFMSMLSISSLNEIMNNHQNSRKNAADILNQLRNMVKNSLHQTGKKDLTKDGIDMAFCVVDQKNMQMDFAGAFNPLYLFRNGDFYKYEADRMPVGIYHTEKESFTNHRINIKKGDVLYMFSDGYVDQFGGQRNKKFKPKKFINLLSEIHQKPMEEQHQILNQTFRQWKGDNFQVDDILVMGIRI